MFELSRHFQNPAPLQPASLPSDIMMYLLETRDLRLGESRFAHKCQTRRNGQVWFLNPPGLLARIGVFSISNLYPLHAHTPWLGSYGLLRIPLPLLAHSGGTGTPPKEQSWDSYDQVSGTESQSRNKPPPGPTLGRSS